MMMNEELRQLKKAMAVMIGEDQSVGAETFDFFIHGVPMRFRCEDSHSLRLIIERLPKKWLANFKSEDISEQVVTVYWRQGSFSDKDIWDDANPDCEQFTVDQQIYAVQRDFIARRNGNSVYLLTGVGENDGFHNFLRWLLPVEFIRRQQVLMHSSAIIDEQGNAFVCLGASGAGKTTMAQFMPESQVLGDDMNLLRVEGLRCLVAPAAVGQAIQNSSLLGNEYPVKAFFQLEKSDHTRLQRQKPARAGLGLYAGVANLFMGQLDDEIYLSLQKIIFSLSQSVPYYNLQFPLDRKVWSYVFNNQ